MRKSPYLTPFLLLLAGAGAGIAGVWPIAALLIVAALGALLLIQLSVTAQTRALRTQADALDPNTRLRLKPLRVALDQIHQTADPQARAGSTLAAEVNEEAERVFASCVRALEIRERLNKTSTDPATDETIARIDESLGKAEATLGELRAHLAKGLDGGAQAAEAESALRESIGRAQSLSLGIAETTEFIRPGGSLPS
ncbi:MAG: hypothetical protein HY248_05040 [Fimbriimonas ginsengisoli]|uniref:Uncharacterized protein n=1 Tax=Fimbriimonas ginsengisoli TaxID=1005039 RepID=A0A931PUK7_FIMGI|nr:hypothetical protein [Fimbriimonas ginsengisoli]MBI3721901.1 hypothetical protein [Fimbriimonas ginsengisoli]